MKAFIFFLLFGLATSVNAQTVTVRSGAHDGYTRLVLSFPQLGDWTLSREPDGYSLTIANQNPTYALKDVFKRIETNRLSQIFWATDEAALKLKVACDCHVIPFVLRDGILVLDIKDGAPPSGSSFELAVDGSLLPPLEAARPPQPKNRPENRAKLVALQAAVPPTLPNAISQAARVPIDLGVLENVERTPALGQVKEDLLWQLSKGAAEGVVEVSEPFKLIDATPVPNNGPRNMQIGAEVGLVPDTTKREVNRMTGQGDSCILDDALDISAWSGELDVISGFAPNTTQLVGEFDRPDPDAIARTVRYLLSLGFGAEARLLLTAFNVDLPDRAIWETLSHIVDLEVPPGDVFSNMEVCDTSAALWSLMSRTEIPPLNQVAIPTVLRSFSTLPLHLRRTLGPDLAGRFLARNDAATARAIRDSILRAPGDSGDRVQMLQAEIALANGNAALAEDILSPLSGGTGPLGLRSTVTLIQTQVDGGAEVSQDLITTAESLLQEARGGSEEDLLTAALALGYAAQNRFEAAFDILAPTNQDTLPIWNVLADRGNDAEVLRWALFDRSEMPPSLDPAAVEKIARHLLALGFPDHALKWIKARGHDPGEWAESTRILAAEAALSLSNLPQALAFIEGLPSDPATSLRGTILAGMRTNDAVDYLKQTGQAIEAAKLAKQTRNWSELSSLDQGGVWQAATALIQPSADAVSTSPSVPFSDTVTDDFGPLAQTRAALEESAAARTVLDQLLADQKIP